MSTLVLPEPVSAENQSAQNQHLPSLDGLRALSIFLVLLGHVSETRGFPAIDLQIGDYSHLGVMVFFVMSGFLITRLMLLEHGNKGLVSLRRFYERRALRLFPASYLYITCACLLSLAGVYHLRSTDIWHAITYTVNFLPQRAKLIGHLWSLSVEEQFYLLWPFTFVLFGIRRSAWVAAATILFAPMARLAAWLFLRKTAYWDIPMFPLVADSIATGCLLINVRNWLEDRSWYLKLFRPAYSIGLLILTLILNRYLGYAPVWVFGTSIINLCLAVLLHRCVYFSTDWTGRTLNWKPVAFLGALSYSLYVWQQIFLNRDASFWVNRFPQNVLFTFAAALCSYFLLERPLLELRRRLRE